MTEVYLLLIVVMALLAEFNVVFLIKLKAGEKEK